MRVWLLPSLLLLFCISCSKDRAIRPEEPQYKITGLLKSMTLKVKDSAYRYEYAYIDSLSLKSITYISGNKLEKESFHYENDTLKTSFKGDTIKRYMYENGRLKYLEKRLSDSSKIFERSIFSYYVTGKLFSIERRSINGFSDDFLGEITFTWSGKNVSSMRESFRNWLMEDTRFLYENTRDPLYSLYSNTLRIPPDGIEGLSFNNYEESEASFSGIKYKCTGEYNEDGLPLKRSILKREGAEWATWKEYTFEYYE